jgi:hypothetical protein
MLAHLQNIFWHIDARRDSPHHVKEAEIVRLAQVVERARPVINDDPVSKSRHYFVLVE